MASSDELASAERLLSYGDNRERRALTDAYDTLCKAAGVIVQQEGGVVGARALAYAECAEIVRKMRDGTGENST